MRAALVEDGPGRWRLNAYKNYSTLGDVAQGVLVWCRWPGGEGAKGIGAVIVPTDRDGVSVTGRHKGMGIHAATEAELAFDGVEITEDDVLIAGDPADTSAFKVLLSHLNHERCGNASMCVGAAQGALEHAVRYMNERVIGGRPLADLQGLQWKLADMAVQLEGARLLLARAVRLAGPHGTPPALETALAKTAANLAAKFVCDEAMQIHGGYGYSREYPLERAYRDIRGLCFGAGTVEAQKQLHRAARGRRGPDWFARLAGPAGVRRRSGRPSGIRPPGSRCDLTFRLSSEPRPEGGAGDADLDEVAPCEVVLRFLALTGSALALAALPLWQGSASTQAPVPPRRRRKVGDELDAHAEHPVGPAVHGRRRLECVVCDLDVLHGRRRGLPLRRRLLRRALERLHLVAGHAAQHRRRGHLPWPGVVRVRRRFCVAVGTTDLGSQRRRDSSSSGTARVDHRARDGRRGTHELCSAGWRAPA